MMRALTLLVVLFLPPLTLQAQDRISVSRSSGTPAREIRVVAHQGFAAFEARALEGLGWEVEEGDRGLRVTYLPDGPTVELQVGSPFLRWGDSGVHLAQAPYRNGGQLHLPVQFLVDVLPWKLPETYRYRAGSWALEVVDGESPGEDTAEEPPAQSAPQDPIRVVVIDAGHGGRDPGSTGRGGTREKDVVLGVARELARILSTEEKVEVHLTRDSDVLIPIWQRGELANQWKGSRHGVFISIHANALPNSSATQGFETYFLSEARTDHERRVAALENSAMELEGDEDLPQGGNPDLSHILTELRNLDHAHWSSLLAENIQNQVDPIHPGRNRGVKQAPLAVITNSLMPAVLFEIGFLSNREEERLLNRESFQKDVAQALAAAILEFFQRYPPGGAWGEGGTP
jgi:N-acetylmuramoyl-L-alanine amidase